MEINVSQEQGRVPVTVFHIKGDIDAETYGQLEERTRQAIQGGTRNLVLDLSQVNYISSYGIRGLSEIFNWLRDAATEDDKTLSHGLRDGKFKAQHLKLAQPSQQVQRVLSIAGIDMFLDIHKDIKSAVAAF